MKFYDTHFEEYISSSKQKSLHPKLIKRYTKFPKNLSDLKNIIFYGPSGVGKYTQLLTMLEQYSPTKLKYEKRISVTCAKNTYVFKISDIHFEIDMSLLGCNAKTLWNDIYNHIIDIILARSDSTGVIVCKYFHEIHSELLESFYSYMHTLTNSSIDLKFILLTEEISFIPDNITQRCQLIRVPRPSRAAYNSILDVKIKRDVNLNVISNIKNNIAQVKPLLPNKVLCDDLIQIIIEINENKFTTLREKVYEIFIYDIDVTACIWYIFSQLIKSNHIKNTNIDDILIKTVQFLQYYNNNYRPIYHLENYILYLCKKVHGF